MSRTVRMVIACAAIWCAVAGAGLLFAAQIPKSEKEIPVISGATRDAAAEAELKEQTGEEQDFGPGSSSVKIYRSAASPEDVLNFYLQKIGGKEDALWDGDPASLAKDGTSPVGYEVSYYDEGEDFTDYETEGGAHPGKWVKQSLSKNRKPAKPGMWIKEAQFFWSVKAPNGDMTDFNLDILDASFGYPEDYQSKKYKTATRIQLNTSTRRSEAAMREESDERMEREVAARAKALGGKPPTEKDLGVPIYPGASFNAEASAGMSLGDDYAMYIYLSGDQPSKVAAFYEQKLKKKAEKSGDSYMIPLKGKPPVPEEGIVIEPNTMFGGSAKTVITIQKMTGGGEE